MSVIDQLKADFLPRSRELDFTTLTLSNGDEIKVFYAPVANTAQSDKYMPLLQQNKLQGYVELLIVRAKNEDKTPMFTGKDRDTLMKSVDPVHIVDIGNKKLGADDEADPQAEKEREEIAKK